jgi:hypothetical protein
LNEQQAAEAAQLYESGVALAKVAKQFRVDRRYLGSVLRQAGVVIRPRGRQPK